MTRENHTYFLVLYGGVFKRLLSLAFFFFLEVKSVQRVNDHKWQCD